MWASLETSPATRGYAAPGDAFVRLTRLTKRPPARVYATQGWRPERRDAFGLCADRWLRAFEGTAVSGTLDRCRCWSRRDLADRATQAAPHLRGLVAFAVFEGVTVGERRTVVGYPEEVL